MAAVLRRAFLLVRWLVVLEIGIWRSLFLLVARRVPGDGAGVKASSYARDITPIMGALIFVSVLELVVVHLLLPWETIRLIADVLGIWGLLWMVGFLASMKVFPHLLDDHGLRVRHRTTVDIRIPWDAIASVTSRRADDHHVVGRLVDPRRARVPTRARVVGEAAVGGGAPGRRRCAAHVLAAAAAEAHAAGA